MVADIQLLQGKVIDEPERRTKNISSLIQELALEILSDDDVAVAATVIAPVTSEEPA
ncbi:MAG: hypothetical protein JST80_10015 [Bdellovibrionales bacterium]|nr:hypothetical protein [Bdellovibrionales bacterium]